MRNEEDLDKLLDRALQAYSEQEPRLGMEARVLRRAGARRQVWWLLAGLPVAAAAAGVVMLMVPAQHKRDALVVAVAKPVEVSANRPEITPVPRPFRRSAPGHQPLVAPPARPTPELLALMSLASNYPEQARMLLREFPAELSVPPLSIEPIAIELLETADKEK